MASQPSAAFPLTALRIPQPSSEMRQFLTLKPWLAGMLLASSLAAHAAPQADTVTSEDSGFAPVIERVRSALKRQADLCNVDAMHEVLGVIPVTNVRNQRFKSTEDLYRSLYEFAKAHAGYLPSIEIYYAQGNQRRPSCGLYFSLRRKHGSGITDERLKQDLALQRVSTQQGLHDSGVIEEFIANPAQGLDGVRFTMVNGVLTEIMVFAAD